MRRSHFRLRARWFCSWLFRFIPVSVALMCRIFPGRSAGPVAIKERINECARQRASGGSIDEGLFTSFRLKNGRGQMKENLLRLTGRQVRAPRRIAPFFPPPRLDIEGKPYIRAAAG